MKHLLIFAAIICGSFAATAQAKHCTATTKKGTTCKSYAMKGTGFCYIHNPTTPTCQAKTKDGDKCQRKAAKGANYCSTHNPSK